MPALCRFKVIYIPSSTYMTGAGIDNVQNDALVQRKADLVYYVNELGGSLISLVQVRYTHTASQSTLAKTVHQSMRIDVASAATTHQGAAPSEQRMNWCWGLCQHPWACCTTVWLCSSTRATGYELGHSDLHTAAPVLQAGLTKPYGWLPMTLTYVSKDYTTVSTMGDLRAVSPATTEASLEHRYAQRTGPFNQAFDLAHNSSTSL